MSGLRHLVSNLPSPRDVTPQEAANRIEHEVLPELRKMAASGVDWRAGYADIEQGLIAHLRKDPAAPSPDDLIKLAELARDAARGAFQ